MHENANVWRSPCNASQLHTYAALPNLGHHSNQSLRALLAFLPTQKRIWHLGCPESWVAWNQHTSGLDTCTSSLGQGRRLTSLLCEEGVRSSYFLPLKMSTPTKWHLAWPCFPVFDVDTSTTCKRFSLNTTFPARWSCRQKPKTW